MGKYHPNFQVYSQMERASKLGFKVIFNAEAENIDSLWKKKYHWMSWPPLLGICLDSAALLCQNYHKIYLFDFIQTSKTGRGHLYSDASSPYLSEYSLFSEPFWFVAQNSQNDFPTSTWAIFYVFVHCQCHLLFISLARSLLCSFVHCANLSTLLRRVFINLRNSSGQGWAGFRLPPWLDLAKFCHLGKNY